MQHIAVSPQRSCEENQGGLQKRRANVGVSVSRSHGVWEELTALNEAAESTTT